MNEGHKAKKGYYMSEARALRVVCESECHSAATLRRAADSLRLWGLKGCAETVESWLRGY